MAVIKKSRNKFISFILKKSVGPSNPPFTLRQAQGERGVGSYPMGECVGWVSDSVTQHLPLRCIGVLTSPTGCKNSTNAFFHGEKTGLAGLPQ